MTSDAKATNQQAGAEGMLTALSGALAGADSLLAFGLMDGAETVSLAKIMLDCDIVGALKRYLRDDPIDEARALGRRHRRRRHRRPLPGAQEHAHAGARR